MATQAEYTVGANAAAAVLKTDVLSWVPEWVQGEILAKIPALAGSISKAVVDAVDKERS